MFQKIFLATGFLVVVLLSGCGSNSNSLDFSSDSSDSSDSSSSSSSTTTAIDYSDYIETSSSATKVLSDFTGENDASHEESDDYDFTTSSVTYIVLSDDNSTVSDSTYTTIEENNITISGEGVFDITGTLSDGTVIVDAGDDDVVKIIFDSLSITSSTTAPFYIKNASKVIIELADGTQNYIYDSEDNEEKGSLLSKTDLTLFGEGALTVQSESQDALRSNDGLVIVSGEYNVTAGDDAIRGKDYLIIEGGTFVLSAGGDGLKSDNEDDETRGYILVSDGNFTIESANDGLQAETDLLITDGNFTVTTAGGSSASIDDDTSAKGLKAGVNIFIADGEFNVDSADDSIHSNENIYINNGEFTLASGDDGVHSDTYLEINGGEGVISESYEGLESAEMVLNNGYFQITSSDDGINVAGGADSSSGGSFSSSSNYSLDINDGFYYVDADGDGLDANGYITQTGGIVIVNGPSSGANGAIDYDNYYEIDGGILVAVGTSNMSEDVSSSSESYSVFSNLGSTISAGTLLNIQDSSGTTVLTFESSKSYNSVVFVSDDVSAGTYTIYKGGSSTGTSYHGLILDGTYTAGTKLKTVTVD
ncbi:carbohydrate-binding domain-containing protein [Sulfurimonas sp.]|uniref:carbohydrate-binding domain-containing protein n=2 Tax=Sulfurimonas sp. TaxID=2022749 RepID=UPI003D10139F